MKIGWVIGPFPHPIGVACPNQLLIDKAPSGVEIVVMEGEEFERGLDLYVCTDISSCSHPTWDYIRNHPHVFYPRDYMFMSENWQRLRVPQMISSAQMVIFRSPLHRDEFLRLYKWGRRIRYQEIAVCPTPIDVTKFPGPDSENYPVIRRKRSAALWIASLFTARKGIRAAEAWACENKAKVDFWAFGRPPTFVTQSKRCTVKTPVPYRNMPMVYPKYKRFLFLPVWSDPFSCATAEAVLSGLEIIGNDKIGLFSYPWGRDPLLVRQKLAEAPAEFWRLVLNKE